jgi:hypothetical protein
MDSTSNPNTSQVSVATLEEMFSGHKTALAAKVRAACITFLIVVPLAIVALLMYYANGDYAGSNGSSPDCKVAGYPTNIDDCVSSH